MSDEPQQPKNGIVQALTTLAGGGDNWVKLVTIGLIAVTGGGNFLVTKQVGKTNEQELNRAIAEIHELHSVLFQAIERQKEMNETLKRKFP